MNTLEAIRMRQSCRAYKGEKITDKELDILLKAANAAPVEMSKYNEVKLTVIQNVDLINQIDSLGVKFFYNSIMHPTYGAKTLILVSTIKPESNLNYAPFCNAACIVENMMLAATEMGLGSVYLLEIVAAINRNESMLKKLKIPEGFMISSAMAVGKAKGRRRSREFSKEKISTDIF